MALTTDDLRIRAIKELAPPAHLIREFPCSEKAATVVYEARQAIHHILHGMDDRLIVVVGPCSIHDVRGSTPPACWSSVDASPRIWRS
jgi:3-deoxy-7-phosphoheptulonate synthase